MTILRSMRVLMALVIIILAVGCNKAATYKIPSNLEKEYTVRLNDKEVVVYEDEDLVAKLDSSIRLTHIIFYKNESYLIEEGIRNTVFYTFEGKEVARTLGHILLASGDTLLFTGEQRDYDEEGNVYSYQFVENMDPSKDIHDLSCLEVINHLGRKYVYTHDLQGNPRVYNMNLDPVEDLETIVADKCESDL